MKILINNKEQENIKAIKIDDYWIVIDTKAEIKENDFCTSDKNIIDIGKIHNQYTIFNPKTKDDLEKLKSCWKIIASTKFIDKSIPVIKFVECTVEELAEMYAESKSSSIIFKETHIRDFIAGYMADKSSDKKYTEEDIRLAMKAMNSYKSDMQEEFIEYNFGVKNSDSLNVDEFIDEFIKCLNQTKFPEVINLEMEEIPFVKVSWETDEMFEQRKNNGDKILKLKTKSTPEGEVIEIKI
jgi:hypothetical protein